MKKVSLILALVAGLSASVANASTVTGKITAVQTNGHSQPGWVYFKITPAVGSGAPAACATAALTNFAFFDGDNGQAIENPHVQNLVLAAYNGNKTVTVTGLNVCNNNRELLSGIVIQ